MRLLFKIKEAINQHQLLNPKESVLVALSGGADSVAMLFALRKLGYIVHAAHCNFHLRGKESDRDKAFCEALAARLGIPFYSTDFQTAREAGRRGVSLEMAARDLRYAWFRELLREKGIRRVAVAHHLEDNAETFIINLTRGTGLRGLVGMKWINGEIIRPMLAVLKDEIYSYLQSIAQDYMVDSSNSDVNFTRNKIRHELMPKVLEVNPSFYITFGRTMEHLSASWNLQCFFAFPAVGRITKILRDGISIDAYGLQQLPEVKTILTQIFIFFKFPPSVAADMARHLDDESGQLYETDKYLATRSTDRIEVRIRPITLEDTVLHIGENKLPDSLNLVVQEIEPCQFKRSKTEAYIDLDTVVGKLVVRSTRRGDRFRPYGMQGSKLVSDYLTDRKRTRIDRLATKVVCDDNGIVWIVGERMSHRHIITKDTKRALHIYED